MDNLGERLRYARKKKGFTQDSLAQSIGVSRSVIYNLEKSKTEPKAVFINAIIQVLEINKEWLISGTGNMENNDENTKSCRILGELCEIAGELSEEEQLYLLDTAKSLRQLLKKEKKE